MKRRSPNGVTIYLSAADLSVETGDLWNDPQVDPRTAPLGASVLLLQGREVSIQGPKVLLTQILTADKTTREFCIFPAHFLIGFHWEERLFLLFFFLEY
jgi:hypothetical protein